MTNFAPEMKLICIAGKNQIAVNALRYMIENHPEFEYCFVHNKTDDGVDGWQPSFKKYATQLNVPQVTLKDLYGLTNLIFLSLEFDRLILPGRFATAKLFNFHFSLLPAYKGMFTSIHPMLNGETSSGVTLHLIDEGIDTGNIIDQIVFPINQDMNSRDVYQEYLDNGYELFKRNIGSLLDDTFTSSPQHPFGSSYFSKDSLDFANLLINHNKTAFEVNNQYRAFAFRDYQLPVFNGWKIYKSEITGERSQVKPGNIIFEDDICFEISTIDFNVRLFKDHYDSLWKAAEVGDLDMVKKYSGLVPDLDLRNRNGWNAIILAVYNNRPEVAEYLINQGASVHTVNYKGTTLPMYALSCYENSGDERMFRFILSHDPDLGVKDRSGLNLYDYLKKKNLENLLS